MLLMNDPVVEDIYIQFLKDITFYDIPWPFPNHVEPILEQ